MNLKNNSVRRRMRKVQEGNKRAVKRYLELTQRRREKEGQLKTNKLLIKEPQSYEDV